MVVLVQISVQGIANRRLLPPGYLHIEIPIGIVRFSDGDAAPRLAVCRLRVSNWVSICDGFLTGAPSHPKLAFGMNFK
jgi:hypothetical protein